MMEHPSLMWGHWCTFSDKGEEPAYIVTEVVLLRVRKECCRDKFNLWLLSPI